MIVFARHEAIFDMQIANFSIEDCFVVPPRKDAQSSQRRDGLVRQKNITLNLRDNIFLCCGIKQKLYGFSAFIAQLNRVFVYV
jgi:hypothetical protein